MPHERLPELPVIPREKPHTGATARKNPRDATVIARLTIGAGSVIGSGSVVTRNIPEGVLAFGNPCRVVRKLTGADSVRPKFKQTESSPLTVDKEKLL